MANDKSYEPSIQLTRLYERVSKRTGNHYLSGRLGGAKIAILKSSDVTDDGVPIWNVVLQEAPAARKASTESETRELTYTACDPEIGEVAPAYQARSTAKSRRSTDGLDPGSDEIPF